MKKIILLALIVLMMVGCLKERDPISGEYYNVIVVDSCEYLCGSKFATQGHKGNCRFCKERRQKELEELIIKLKEK